MKIEYKVKLHEGHSANADQQKDGYLASEYQIQKYSRAEALTKAIRFGGSIEKVNYSFFVANLKMGQIDENCLVDGVVRLLRRMPRFRFDDGTTDEIYGADVFQKIIDNYIPREKTFNQLEELADYFSDYDYVMIINRHV